MRYILIAVLFTSIKSYLTAAKNKHADEASSYSESSEIEKLVKTTDLYLSTKPQKGQLYNLCNANGACALNLRPTGKSSPNTNAQGYAALRDFDLDDVHGQKRRHGGHRRRRGGHKKRHGHRHYRGLGW